MPKGEPIVTLVNDPPKYVEDILAILVPCPFVRGQKKTLGECTIKDIHNAALVLEVTDGSPRDIDFLGRVIVVFKDALGTRPIERGDYLRLRSLLVYRQGQLKSKTSKGKKSGKSKTT